MWTNGQGKSPDKQRDRPINPKSLHHQTPLNKQSLTMSKESIHLPKPIAAYFTADKGDSEAVSQCFTENAVVKDEGHTYNGLVAIKQCKAGNSKKYEYTTERFACAHKGGK